MHTGSANSNLIGTSFSSVKNIKKESLKGKVRIFLQISKILLFWLRKMD